MRFKMMMLMITLTALLTACMNQDNVEQTNINVDTETAEINKEDHSVRAMAAHQDGQLIIQPKNHASVATLGAPSCYGLESDISWTGDYEAIWKPASDRSTSKVMTFPSDLEIIQPTDAVVNLQMMTIGDTDFYTYYPRYTDCHALDIYFFGVKSGEAFPISFELEDGKRFTGFVQHPHYPLQVVDNELVITGGEGAGQEFIHVYHFNYDAGQQAFVLQKTDNVTREDLMKQTVDPSGDILQ